MMSNLDKLATNSREVMGYILEKTIILKVYIMH